MPQTNRPAQGNAPKEQEAQSPAAQNQQEQVSRKPDLGYKVQMIINVVDAVSQNEADLIRTNEIKAKNEQGEDVFVRYERGRGDNIIVVECGRVSRTSDRRANILGEGMRLTYNLVTKDSTAQQGNWRNGVFTPVKVDTSPEGFRAEADRMFDEYAEKIGDIHENQAH